MNHHSASAVSGLLAASLVGILILTGCGAVDFSAIEALASPGQPISGPGAAETPDAIVVAAAGAAVATPSPMPARPSPTAVILAQAVAPKEQVATVKSKRADVTGQIRLRGRVAPVSETSLSFERAGQVKSVLVKAGDKVEKGALLVELDDPDQQAQEAVETARGRLEVGRAALATARLPDPPSTSFAAVATAQRQVEAARLRLARVNVGASASEIRTAEIAVEQAKNSLWAAQTSRDGVCGQGPGYACAGADASVANVDIALVAARARLEEVRNRKPAPEDVALAQLEVRSAETALSTAYAQAAYDTQVAQARAAEREANIRAQETEAKHLEAAVSRSEARVAQLKLTAPTGGTVISLNAKVGDQVTALQALITVANPDELGIEATVAEADAPWVSVGQEAQITLDSATARQYQAKVAQIADKPAQGQRTYAVRLSFAGGTKPTAAIGNGADIFLSVTKRQVITVPKAAVVQDGDRRVVTLSTDTGLRRVSVVVGLSNDADIEITSGVPDGADVVAGATTGARN